MTLAAQLAPDYQQQRLRKAVLRNRRRYFITDPAGLSFEMPVLSGGAGSYPDVPSRRMAWHDDGTVFVAFLSGSPGGITEYTGSTLIELNDEDETLVTMLGTGGGFSGTRYEVCIFPELREFDGAFQAVSTLSGGGTAAFESSGDTTNGIDGTWTQRVSPYGNTQVYPDYRNEIQSVAVSNVRGVRKAQASANNTQIRAIHYYGEISAGETPDRLLWFDDLTDLEFSKPIDYGDKPRGSAEDYVVYLKNNSGSLSASSVQVTATDLYLGSGAWFTFSEGGAFQATLALGASIGAGANSPNITIRCIRPDAATLGLHAAYTYANVGSWA